jgi:class 3 adenylate cyclase
VADVVPSEELRSFLLRLYCTWEAQDFEALREMYSASPHSLTIGTDPNEWWIGSEGLDIWIVQTREIGGLSVQPGRPTAYCCGNVGWVADQPLVTFGNGAVGLSLTTSVDKIERSVRHDRPDMRRASAPDGTVTIVFSDIESSTVLLDRLGDTGFLRMLAWHDRIVRDTAEEHRGFVVKSQGDGFMLAFPSAASALRASLVMRDRIDGGFDALPIRIRAGLHSGEAIKHDDDFYGRTVVIAARISALALGGEILASDLVYALARGLGTFRFGDPRTATLKGLDGSFDLHPVIG